MCKKLTAFLDDIKQHVQEYEVIPCRAPWWFRYNLQGLLAVKKYLELYFLQRNLPNLEKPSVLLECAKDNFHASQFACEFGKKGNACMRRLSIELEKRNVLSRNQLQALIHNYVLRPCLGGGVQLKASLFWAICMSIFLVALAAYTVILSLAVLFTGVNALQAVGVIAIIILISGVGGYCFYYCAIKPYLITRQVGSVILECADTLCIHKETGSHLRLV